MDARMRHLSSSRTTSEAALHGAWAVPVRTDLKLSGQMWHEGCNTSVQQQHSHSQSCITSPCSSGCSSSSNSNSSKPIPICFRVARGSPACLSRVCGWRERASWVWLVSGAAADAFTHGKETGSWFGAPRPQFWRRHRTVNRYTKNILTMPSSRIIRGISGPLAW